MASEQVDVLVIGMGPTGLGAAKRLHHLVWFTDPHPGPAQRRRLIGSANIRVGYPILAHC